MNCLSVQRVQWEGKKLLPKWVPFGSNYYKNIWPDPLADKHISLWISSFKCLIFFIHAFGEFTGLQHCICSVITEENVNKILFTPILTILMYVLLWAWTLMYWWMFLCTFLFVYSVCELKRVHIYIFVWVYGVCVPLYICMCEVVLEIVVVVSMCVCGKKQVAVRVWVHLGADDSLWGSFYVGRQTKECGSVILREILYYAAVVLGRYTDTYRSHREMLKRKRERMLAQCLFLSWH